MQPMQTAPPVDPAQRTEGFGVSNAKCLQADQVPTWNPFSPPDSDLAYRAGRAGSHSMMELPMVVLGVPVVDPRTKAMPPPQCTPWPLVMVQFHTLELFTCTTYTLPPCRAFAKV